MAADSASRLRVGIVIDQLASAGTELQTTLLAAELSRAGHSVSLLVLGHATSVPQVRSELEATGVRTAFLELNGSVFDLFRARSQVASWANTGRFDVIYALMSRASTVCGSLVGVRAWPPTVMSRRSLVDAGRDSRVAALVRRSAIRRANAIVANSTAVAVDSSILEGVGIDRYVVIPNMLPEAAFEVVGPAIVETDKPVVVSVANLREPKDHRNLLNALADLKQSGQEVTAVLVGDGPLRQQIDRHARDLDIDVHLGGSVDDPRPYLAAADVFVQSSQTEGSSNSLMEAMAAGCAIVATDVGGTAEALDGSGILVPAKDPGGLADGIRRVLTSPELAQRLRAKARAHASTFSVGASVASHVALFERLTHR